MTKHCLLEATLENVEAVIDAATDNEILKNIPVVGTAVKLVKEAVDIRDRMFAAKLTTFLQALNETTPEAREKLRQKIASSPDEAKEVGETLLLVLDKTTTLKKAEIIAYIFIAYTLEHITATDFRRLLDATDQAFIDDLIDLLSRGGHSNQAYMKHLSRTGLTFADPRMTFRTPEDFHYAVSRLGKQLIGAYSEAMKYCLK